MATLSGGGLGGILFVYLQGMSNKDNISCKCLLYITWAAFIISLILLFGSLYCGSKAHQIQMRHIDDDLKERENKNKNEEKETRKKNIAKANGFRIGSAISLLLGIVSITFFVGVNMS